MKAGRYLIALSAVLALGLSIGCSKSNEQKEDFQLSQEANNKIAQSYANLKDIKASYGFDLTADPSDAQTAAKAVDWSKFTPAQRAQLQQKLFAQMSWVRRIFEIAQHKGMSMRGSGADLQTSSADAGAYWTALKAYRASIGEK